MSTSGEIIQRGSNPEIVTHAHAKKDEVGPHAPEVHARCHHHLDGTGGMQVEGDAHRHVAAARGQVFGEGAEPIPASEAPLIRDADRRTDVALDEGGAREDTDHVAVVRRGGLRGELAGLHQEIRDECHRERPRTGCQVTLAG